VDDARLGELLGCGPHDPATRRSVGGALMRRSRWAEARQVLEAAVRVSPGDAKARAMLARAALHDGDPELALTVIEGLPEKMRAVRAVWRMRIVARERVERGAEGRSDAIAYLSSYPDDTVVAAVVKRLEGEPERPNPRWSAVDPHVSVGRAVAYARRGDLDRAVRTLRRVQHHRPDPLMARQLLEWEAALAKRQGGDRHQGASGG